MTRRVKNPGMTAGESRSLNLLFSRVSLAGEEWMRDAACARHPRPDIWFATRDPGRYSPPRSPEQSEAIRICMSCPPRVSCAEYAVANDEYGIWGGLDEDQRQQLRRA